MFDRETWRFVNTFAPWLSAVGTLTAVIVSLYLARRASRLDFHVAADIVNTVYQDEIQTRTTEYLEVRIVNRGRGTVVNGIAWWRGPRTKKHWVAIPTYGYRAVSLPKRLEFSDEALILFPTETFNDKNIELLRDIKSARFPSLRVRFLRVGVYTSTGQQFRVALDEHVRKFLIERASQVSES